MKTKVLDLQRQGQQIRIGQQVPAKRGGTRPDKLSTFRFTTGSRFVAESVAALYGGQVVDWQRGQYEVITTESALFVTIPPRDQIVSQAYEMWNGGGCVRRCDSQREEISGGRCLCPHAEDTTNADEVDNAARRRAELSKLNPPQACKLVTRISVMLPDLPGLGVWRLDTHSYYAAVEIGDQAELMEKAREHGVFLRAVLRIDQRARVAGGQTTNYPVPVLEILDTFRDLVTGAIENRPMAAQLPPAPGQPIAAITAGPSKTPAELPAPSRPLTAQQIADRAREAAHREVLVSLNKMAEDNRVKDDIVCVDEVGQVYDELHTYLQRRWREMSADQAVPDGPQTGFDFEG
jgi:hypothetical protein